MPYSVIPSHQFIGADAEVDSADWVVLGFPFDSTCSYRPGTRFGPLALRQASWGLETYSPALNLDLADALVHDGGELELPMGSTHRALTQIESAVQDVLARGQRCIGLGGEHLVTLPIIWAYRQKYPDLKVIQFDAHTDLRESYLEEPLSHACVMRRVAELLGPEALVQIGIRSGTSEEFEWMATHKTQVVSSALFQMRLLPWIDSQVPIYVTIDLDVLDPSVFPGTGTPEPGGMQFNQLMEWLTMLKRANIVGFDVVELSPPYDASGVSNVVAAKVVRELLLIANQSLA